MEDKERNERIFLLLSVWFHITKSGLVWTEVKSWLESRINAELGNDQSKIFLRENGPK